MTTQDYINAITPEGIRQALEDAGLAHLWRRIEPELLPALAITTAAADDSDLPVGASKFGGCPDLPRGGLLSFFYDDDATGSPYVRYFPPETDLERIAPPTTLTQTHESARLDMQVITRRPGFSVRTWMILGGADVDSEVPNWWWGKAGSLIFSVPHSDARRGDFRRVHVSNPSV